MAEQIGFIGLGIMGKPMARNLLKAGYSLIVYDIVGSNQEEVVTDGATGASNSKEVAAARHHNHDASRLGRFRESDIGA